MWFTTGEPPLPGSVLPDPRGKGERICPDNRVPTSREAGQQAWPINTSRGRQGNSIAEAPLWFLQASQGGKRQQRLCSESKAVYFYAFKKENCLSPHKGKKRECKYLQPGSHKERVWGPESQQRAPTTRPLNGKRSPHRPTATSAPYPTMWALGRFKLSEPQISPCKSFSSFSPIDFNQMLQKLGNIFG